MCLYVLEELPAIVQKRLQSFFGDYEPKSILAEEWNESAKRIDFAKTAKEYGGIIFSKFDLKRSDESPIPGLENTWIPFEVTIEKLPEQLDVVKGSVLDLNVSPIVVVDSINALTALSKKSC